MNIGRKILTKGMLGATLYLMSTPVFAGGALPWEAPLCMVAKSLMGPVASATAVIVVVVTGLMFAFGEASGAFKTGLTVLGGLAFALLAVKLLSTIFGASDGSTFNFGQCG